MLSDVRYFVRENRSRFAPLLASDLPVEDLRPWSDNAKSHQAQRSREEDEWWSQKELSWDPNSDGAKVDLRASVRQKSPRKGITGYPEVLFGKPPPWPPLPPGTPSLGTLLRV